MRYQLAFGFAEYMMVPREVFAVGGLNRIPDGLGFAEAAAIVRPDLDVVLSENDPVDAVMTATSGRGADVVITAAASGRAQEQGLRMLARCGRLSLFGGLGKDAPEITVDSNLVHYRELTIVGVNGSSPAQNRQALDPIAAGAVVVNT